MNRGYYKVGDKIYHNKTLALEEASKTNSFPTWHFGEEVFSKFNWSVKIDKSIEQLYRDRCQQLRQKYDHLVLLFSGGSDSATVLRSFLENNIALDEIYVYWPVAAFKKIHKPNKNNLDPSNLASEWEYSILPQLEKLKIINPKIKITIEDYSEKLFKEFDEKMFLLAGHGVNPGLFLRQDILLTAVKNLKENKKIAIITGNDKPQICVENNTIYGYFIDALFTTSRTQIRDDNRVIELFYYSHDLPELPIKGCQLLAEHLEKNKHLAKYFINKKLSYEENATKDSIIRSVVYKDWDNSTFQVGKARTHFLPEYDNWIQYNFGDDKFFKSWHSTMQFYFANIDKKYFHYNENGEKTGYIGFVSPFYKICYLE
jgi:hypothetical protein